MLLAAGHGARMEPLTSWIAKPALDVLGRPLLASGLAHLHAFGCTRIAANLHRHPDQVEAALRASSESRADILLSREATLLGGAGGVAAALPLLGPGPLLVANADVWAALDLAPLRVALCEDSIVLALTAHPDPARWSSVLLDEGGRVAAFLPAGARPDWTPYLFTGFQLLGAAAVAALPPPPAEWRPVWLAAKERGLLRGAVVTGRWREAGTPPAYRDLVLEELGTTSWIHPTAAVAADSVVRHSAVAAASTVASGAQVVDSVLIAGATVGVGARLQRCVVAGPARVDTGDALADTLVLPDRRVPL
jgi:N-acetyl-alpha-D-muramate 1-phosphate uridylyltransferase